MLLPGKFWHRHRRPRPVDYHADAEYHINLKLEAERARAPARRRGAAALRAHNAAQQEQSPPLSATPLSTTEHESSATLPRHDVWIEVTSPRKARPPYSSDPVDPVERPLSPASSISSSASERPLAQTVLQVNGVNHKPMAAANTSQMHSAAASEPPPSSESNARESSRAPMSSNTQVPVTASETAHTSVTHTPGSAQDSTSVVGTPPATVSTFRLLAL